MTNGNIHNYIKNRLICVRREKNLTQEELAGRLNFSQAWLSKIESGKKNVNLETLNNLAKALNCRIYDLLPEYPL